MDNPIRTSVPAPLTMRRAVLPTAIFVVLVAVTFLSSVGAETSFFSHRGAAKFVIGAAMLKSALVVYFFMGVGQSHKIVRVLVLLWAIGLSAVLTFYALAAI